MAVTLCIIQGGPDKCLMFLFSTMGHLHSLGHHILARSTLYSLYNEQFCSLFMLSYFQKWKCIWGTELSHFFIFIWFLLGVSGFICTPLYHSCCVHYNSFVFFFSAFSESIFSWHISYQAWIENTHEHSCQWRFEYTL